MSNHNEISSFIWNVCDDVLRGLFKQHEYGDVILPFLVLRRLDCVIEPKKDEIIELYNELKDEVDPTPIIKKQTGLKFFNHSNYDLQRLKGDPNGLKVNFPNYISGFSQNVFEILENFQLEKPVEKLLKNNKLYLLVDKFTEIELHPNKVDNHTMGQVFEELLRKFSEMSNETSGEHYTPRDVVKLLVSMVFSENTERLDGVGIIRSIYDPCSGTGGILSVGKDWVETNIKNDVRLNLFGQELNPHTFSICKSDMLISGENPENIKLGSSLSNDHFEGKKFDYMITNPPYGVSWKGEKEFINNEKSNPNGRFSEGVPRSSDGQLLFLQHMISKMKEDGSRIGVVFNGSPMFTGDSGSGESDIRKWIIEKDWLESVVRLPEQLFFNTGITTYIWIINNKKKESRKGKIQLIDGSSFCSSLRKNLGNKRYFISDNQIDDLIDIYTNNENGEFCKIYDNDFFGYTKVTIEQPIIEDGEIVTKKDGSPKPDTSKRDYERIPFSIDIDEFFQKEVKPFLPNSWIDKSKNITGYEINLTKYFYQFKRPRTLSDLHSDLEKLEELSKGVYNKIVSDEV